MDNQGYGCWREGDGTGSWQDSASRWPYGYPSPLRFPRAGSPGENRRGGWKEQVQERSMVRLLRRNVKAFLVALSLKSSCLPQAPPHLSGFTSAGRGEFRRARPTTCPRRSGREEVECAPLPFSLRVTVVEQAGLRDNSTPIHGKGIGIPRRSRSIIRWVEITFDADVIVIDICDGATAGSE